MTIGACIERVDRQKPNAIEEQEKAQILLTLEAQLYREFYSRYEEPAPAIRPTKEIKDVPLSGSGPFEEFYVFYLIARIDLMNQEYDQYQNDVALYNQAVGEFRRDYHRRHTTKPTGRVRNLI